MDCLRHFIHGLVINFIFIYLGAIYYVYYRFGIYQSWGYVVFFLILFFIGLMNTVLSKVLYGKPEDMRVSTSFGQGMIFSFLLTCLHGSIFLLHYQYYFFRLEYGIPISAEGWILVIILTALPVGWLGKKIAFLSAKKEI